MVCKIGEKTQSTFEQIIIPFKNTGTQSLTTVSDIKSFTTCIGNNYQQVFGKDQYLG